MNFPRNRTGGSSNAVHSRLIAEYGPGAGSVFEESYDPCVQLINTADDVDSLLGGQFFCGRKLHQLSDRPVHIRLNARVDQLRVRQPEIDVFDSGFDRAQQVADRAGFVQGVEGGSKWRRGAAGFGGAGWVKVSVGQDWCVAVVV
jgi:hypothetical protein